LLHAAIIALALISFQPSPSLEASQPGVSVVFDNGGAQQNTAPPAQTQGPLTAAQAPTPAAPPPPTAAQSQQPEVNLDLPTEPLAQLSLPPPQAQSQERHVQHIRPTPHRQYQLMNNMSLGNPAPPMPNAKHGLNLQLSQSDLNAMNTPQISVQGEIGQDWMDGFNKWVNDHIYYPQAAVEQGQQGTSTIEFTVHRDGSITGLHLLDSAGSPFLDQAWLGIFAQNNVPPFPPGTKSDTLKITATLHYELLPP
jgi:protein TonB